MPRPAEPSTGTAPPALERVATVDSRLRNDPGDTWPGLPRTPVAGVRAAVPLLEHPTGTLGGLGDVLEPPEDQLSLGIVFAAPTARRWWLLTVPLVVSLCLWGALAMPGSSTRSSVVSPSVHRAPATEPPGPTWRSTQRHSTQTEPNRLAEDNPVLDVTPPCTPSQERSTRWVPAVASRSAAVAARRPLTKPRTYPSHDAAPVAQPPRDPMALRR
jgi:hypothetical protein